MTDPAAAPAAPAAPAPAAPPSKVHAGDNFEEFRAQVQARAASTSALKPPVKVQPAPQAPAAQPPTPPAPPAETPPAETQAESTIPAETPPDPNAPPPDPNAPPQFTQEDIDLLAKAKAWLASDEIPEEFAQRLVALKNGDDIEYEAFDEVRNGRMRQRDYTRAMQTHQREKEQWDSDRGFYENHFAAIFNDENNGLAGGEAMYEIYTRAGKRKQLLALGRRLALEEQGIVDAANGVGIAIMRRLGIKDDNDYRVQKAIEREYKRRHEELDRDAQARAMAMENEQLRKGAEARKQETENETFFEGQRKSLEQLRPRAFTAMGLNHEDPTHRQHFNVYLDAIIRQEKVKKLTPELVLKAARAAKDEVELQRKRLAGGGGAKPPQNRPGFQPQLGVGGGAPAGAPNSQWHSETFAEKFLPRWAGR